ncbi:MAG: hypothetical protein ACLQED_12170 [Desulfobaccales bacterium]
MATKQFFTGMRGVFLVAAELARQDFIVSLTSRGAMGADLLVTDQFCKRTFSVQVKTNAKNFGFWLLNKNAKEYVSPTQIYVLLNIRKNDEKEFFVVPSKIISDKMAIDKTKESTWPYINYSDAEAYRNGWHLFKSSH